MLHTRVKSSLFWQLAPEMSACSNDSIDLILPSLRRCLNKVMSINEKCLLSSVKNTIQTWDSGKALLKG